MPRLDDPLGDHSPLIDQLQARWRELARKEKQHHRQQRKLLCRQLGLEKPNPVDVGSGGTK